MLTSLALLLAVQNPFTQGPIRNQNEAETLDAVRAAGYAVTTAAEGSSFAHVSRGGSAATVSVGGIRWGYMLRAQIDVSQAPDAAALRDWWWAARPRLGYGVGANLGPTVDVMAVGQFTGDATPTDAKARLDEFFDFAEKVARHVGGGAPKPPRIDWRDAAFPDATVVRTASYESLLRAFRSWGWLDRRAQAFMASGWIEGMMVGGKRVWARSVDDGGHPSSTAFEIVAIDPDEPGEPTENAKGLPGSTFGRVSSREFKSHRDEILVRFAWHKPEARTVIDLAPGVLLGDIRQRIEAFARASGTSEAQARPRSGPA